MAASVAKLVQDFSLISAESQRNLGWKGLADVNFNAIWQTLGAVVCKRNRVYIFSRLSTMQYTKMLDRQIKRQTTEW